MITTPLQGKKVLVPRGAKEAQSFSQLVEQAGGVPVEIPLIAFRPVEPDERLKGILKDLDTYDWIIFTSKVTVEKLFSFLPKDAIRTFPKVAVIGKKTAEALEKIGITPDFVPGSYVSESFVVEFKPLVFEGMKVFIPKGNLARELIAASLTEFGAIVDEAVIYETYMPDSSRNQLAGMLAAGQLEILMFTSPSTVDHLMAVVEKYHLHSQIKECIISCIGPSTEKKLHEYGLIVHASPQRYTVKDMIDRTISYLAGAGNTAEK